MDKAEKWIKRKFFLKESPGLDVSTKASWERYYISRDNGNDLRIQKINDRYELERMTNESDLTRNKFTIPISKNEFDLLRKLTKEEVQRDSYLLPGVPIIWIMIYKGKFQGLGRIEVQFENEEDALQFVPLSWFGKEITGTPLEKEDSLLDLSNEQFGYLLKTNL